MGRLICCSSCNTRDFLLTLCCSKLGFCVCVVHLAGGCPTFKDFVSEKGPEVLWHTTRQLKHIVTHPHSVDQTQRIAHQNLPFPLKGAYPQPDFLPWSLVKSVLCALAASAWLAQLRLRTYSWSMCHHRQRQDFQQRMTDSSSTTCGVIILFCGLFSSPEVIGTMLEEHRCFCPLAKLHLQAIPVFY